MTDSPLCRSGAEIARYIGINADAVPRYKKDYGLPAWKIEDKGKWKALKSSLNVWMEEMENANLKR